MWYLNFVQEEVSVPDNKKRQFAQRLNRLRRQYLLARARSTRLLEKLRVTCDHPIVYHSSSSDEVYTSHSYVCLMCGLREGGIDKGADKLAGRPTVVLSGKQQVGNMFFFPVGSQFAFPTVEAVKAARRLAKAIG